MREQTAQTIANFLYESSEFYSDPEHALEEISEMVENEVSLESIRDILNLWQNLYPREKEDLYATGEIIGVIKNMARPPLQEAA